MALEAKDIQNAADMRRYVEGCLNNLMNGLSTHEETMEYFKQYTHRIIDITIKKMNASNEDDEGRNNDQ